LLTVFGPFLGGYSPSPLSLGFWLIRGRALGLIGGLSARQFNSCLPRREEKRREEKREKRLDIALTHIHQFLQFLVHVISRDSKTGCKSNFPKYLAFTYFIMLWSEMIVMTRCPRHCYSVTGALCKNGF